MKKLFAIFLLVLIGFRPVFSQEIKKTLIKAFKSKDSSDFYFKEAKKLIKTDKDEAEYYFAKGARAGDFNKLDSAAIYDQKAIVVFEKFKDYKTLSYLYNNISQTYRKLGEYDKSINASILGLQNAEKEKSDYWIYNFTNNLSLIYHDFENFQKGIYYGKRALDIAQKMPKRDKDMIAAALNSIAICYDDWNKPNEALSYHRQVFKYIKGKDTLGYGHTYNNIGNTLLKQGNYKEAEKWIKIAVAIGEVNERENPERFDLDYYNKATNFTNLAVIATKTNQLVKAEKILEKAKEYSNKSKSAEKLRDYYRAEYEFNKLRKNLQKTVESQEQYIKLRDSVFNKNRDKSFLEIEAKYQNEKKEKELLHQQLEIKKKNTQSLILAITVVGLLIITFLIYRQQKLKNNQQKQEFELKSAIAKIETQSKLQEQRLQISRDLHDNIGSQLTFIISSVDNIKYAFEIRDKKLDSKLSSISNFAKSTIIELRDTIWAMNNSEITFEDLRTRIHNFVEKAQEVRQEIKFSFTIQDNLLGMKFTSVEGMNIYRVIQEAVNNSIKYAESKSINIDIRQLDSQIIISVRDDGKGFDINQIEPGNGIINMMKRIADCSGTMELQSKEGEGTAIIFHIPNK